VSQITALDRLGEQIGTVLRRELPAVRRRRRALLIAGVLSVLVAVPAAGTVTDWAGLAGGETALPTQVREQLRATLHEGRDERGRWRVEAYRAKLSSQGGSVGVCVFASRRDGGSGRCVPEERIGALTVASGGDVGLAWIAGGVVRDPVSRVEVTLRSYTQPTVSEVVAITPAAAPADALRARGLPDDLRPFAVLFTRVAGETTGIRALDQAGHTVAVFGRPARPAPSVAARPSPIPAPEVRP
jgi:hypothetical protein